MLQLFDEVKTMPEKPQKKRRNSLNKDDKTPIGPNSKKQKTTTRLRTTTPRADKNDTKQSGSELESNAGEDQKDTPKAPKSTERKIKKSEQNQNSPKPTTAKKESTPKATRKESESKEQAETGSKVTMMKGKKQTENTDSDDGKQTKRKSLSKKKSEVLGELDKTSVDSLQNTRQRKCKSLDKSVNDENDASEQKSDKENVDVQKSGKTNAELEKRLQETKKAVEQLSTEKGKMATCKDVTLRGISMHTNLVK